ncbi:MAG: hypothetical protein R2882_04860 [Gemmatimonadales bacterium]
MTAHFAATAADLAAKQAAAVVERANMAGDLEPASLSLENGGTKKGCEHK